MKINTKLNIDQIEKLKKIKTWTINKTPNFAQPYVKPALSYALDWLAPELLGTGFEVLQISEFSIEGVIPYQRENLDGQSEVHQGVVLNVALELFNQLFSQHWPKSAYGVQSSQITVFKNGEWKSNLTLKLSLSPEEIDEILVGLQKNEIMNVDCDVKLTTANGLTKNNNVHLLLELKPNKILNYSK